MIFTPIDFTTWPRAEIFYYFSKMAPTGYSITVNVDVTALRETLKEAGKFFPREGRILMPLPLTCRHAATDGCHVADFLTSLQANMDGFRHYL